MKLSPWLSSDRLMLRRWSASDREPFAQLNADPEVMRYLPKTLTRTESDALMDRLEAHFAEQGFGLWAVELKHSQELIGFIGLNRPTFAAPFMPAVEVGWRLARRFWGQGYATEGAIAALDFGFKTLNLPEIIAFTAQGNHRSIAVMQRLGMTHNPAEDFDHPSLPPGHPLQRHVLYRLKSACP